ncbi:Acg family FMN-binding oxidoreductase [Plantactinospora sp. WMMB334]|uniref:Acg family FMN-binding oxidoreductase n=1 Tax=Plantactinospora sp. WMMB334 TaxID=3404119 RepID=UPI003B9234D6
MTTGDWAADADGTPRGLLRACLEAAVAAPSVHNTQPWRFRISGGTVDILADRGRRLAVLDPQGRELLISIGAAVFNLRAAMLAHGRTPVLHLLPAVDEPDLAARITVGPPTRAPATAMMLAEAIPRRHTNRQPFHEVHVPAEALVDLSAAAEAERARLVVTDPRARDAVLDVVRIAEQRRRHDPAYWRELHEWTLPAAERHDGVPPEAFGSWDALETVPIRDFSTVRPAHRRGPAPFEQAPAIAVLYTRGDTPYEWLRGGQALERVLLTATVRGLVSTIMTQPVEVPHLRALLEDPADGNVAQAVLRFGYGPVSAASKRRPLEEVIVPADRPARASARQERKGPDG